MRFNKTRLARLICFSSMALIMAGCSGDDGENGSDGANGLAGSDGAAGFNTLIRTTHIGLDRDCDVGGVKLETGLDSNRNDQLDDSEVSQTSLLCNAAAAEITPNSIKLAFTGRYESGVFGQSAAEIVTFDPATQRSFVVNAQLGELDVLAMDNPIAPIKIGTISVADIAAGAQVNSVAIYKGLIAVAIEAANKTDNGFVAFYRAEDLSKLAQVQVGALPDMLTFTPNGQFLLVANEGEPSDDYQVDPEGSISIISVSDLNNITQAQVRTAGFNAFNTAKAELLTTGVRVYGPNASVAQDLEPEYLAVAPDSKTAWAVLQENNAVAVIDIESASISAILPLGFKDHAASGHGLDLSDTEDGINIAQWPGITGMYQPDAMAAYQVGNTTYLITANEGDARAWGENNAAYFGTAGNTPCNGDTNKGFIEEFRVKHLVHRNGFDRRCGDDLPAHLRELAAGALLNPSVFAYCGAALGEPGNCREDDLLGRVNVSWTMGYQTHADGSPLLYKADGTLPALGETGDRLMYDKLYTYGARSFAIWDTTDMSLKYDSGDFLEQLLASDDCMLGSNRDIPCKDWFNSNHEEGDAFDNRSDNKGPEPEGLAVGKIGNKHYAFIGLERMGGIVVFDISNPAAPVFQDYLNSRDFWDEADPSLNLSNSGDLGPEGLFFVPAKHSPSGQPMLLVGNEVSGTTSVYHIQLQ
ncbi:choice-of-anchor I family protein [Alishewanella sp. HL-SH05]|uniref:choice-of-anchor I family protein n=1 Tax=Alishewanella sp. HL-SH05 TaxID=3461145 RepID=UPI0040422A24